MYCSNCGNKVEGKFCANCGTKVDSPSPPDTNSSGFEHDTDNKTCVISPEVNVKGFKKKEKFATSYFDLKYKLLFVSALIFGIIICLMGYIVCGVIMLILGILLSPPMTKRYSKKVFLILVIITILVAGLSAVLIESDMEDTADSNTQITQNSKFDEQWYNTYRYFTTGQSGTRNTMELYLSNDIYLDVALGGVTEFSISPDEYTEVSGGGYQYISDDQNYQLTYYPEDNNRIELVFAKGVLNYYPASGEDLRELEGVLIGDNWKINIHYVDTEIDELFNSYYIIVNCSMTNISNSERYIDYDVMLDNNGVLVNGYADSYGNALIRPNTTVTTDLRFSVEKNDLSNVQNMYLVIDGDELSLQYF